ncbi:PLP-dependent aminotransferase family protein [Acidianus ambivalens]|uniref:Aminotransferase class I/II-fold pyridoxal phosphate-dependent enzyme n=1 Tax=Acidianus ambivalens TaxID=2283 RepID=A0A650CWV1_ACIAM|nr:PLP-dependent aminotransferase family protein [Acidianus ambivalens]MQL54340.1 aminotransferase class I/II-fold pyridoxal phosphate-dependent enzyme [Acidianus ambivalens]QGR22165.1 aminotransferase class I/II-fold pyridoxal phosphate-dependent enzyme [Acidianus ambivalens]
MINLAYGIPDLSLLPTEIIKEASARVLNEEYDKALQYVDAQGIYEVREAIADFLKLRGVRARPENIILTGGAKEALFLLSYLFNDVSIESPTYQGFISILKFKGLTNVYSVPISEDGINVESLEKIVRDHKFQFFYTVTINNPTGYVTTDYTKKEIIELAEKYGFRIIEDDIYGFFSYEEDVNTFRSFSDSVIYVSSFSKILSPGLRVGFILVNDEDLLNKLIKIKMEVNHQISSLDQLIVKDVIRDPRFLNNLDKAKRAYKEKRDLAMKIISEEFPDYIQCTFPRGGFFTFCSGFNYRRLQGVQVVGGDKFYFEKGLGEDSFRMSFSSLNKEELERNLLEFATILKEIRKN